MTFDIDQIMESIQKGEPFIQYKGDAVSPIGERILGGGDPNLRGTPYNMDKAVERMRETGEGPVTGGVFDARTPEMIGANKPGPAMIKEGQAERLIDKKFRRQKLGGNPDPNEVHKLPYEREDGLTNIEAYEEELPPFNIDMEMRKKQGGGSSLDSLMGQISAYLDDPNPYVRKAAEDITNSITYYKTPEEKRMAAFQALQDIRAGRIKGRGYISDTKGGTTPLYSKNGVGLGFFDH